MNLRTRLVALVYSCLLLCSLLTAQTNDAQPQTVKELTIESIYQPGGVLGRGPENVQWSPDGSKVSFVQRDDSGERGALYYVDVATGKPAVLVASEKLAALAPPASTIKDERQKEAATRYAVAAYHWSPDSKKLLFDSNGQLWLYSLDSATAVQMTSSADATTDPKFSPDGEEIAYVRKHNLVTRGVSKGQEHALTKETDPDLLNGEVDWVYEEELDVRSNYFWSPDGRQIAFLQMNEKEVPTYPITDWIPLNPDVDRQKYPKPGDPNPGSAHRGGERGWQQDEMDLGRRRKRGRQPAHRQRPGRSDSALWMGAPRHAVGDGAEPRSDAASICTSSMWRAASRSS